MEESSALEVECLPHGYRRLEGGGGGGGGGYREGREGRTKVEKGDRRWVKEVGDRGGEMDCASHGLERRGR